MTVVLLFDEMKQLFCCQTMCSRHAGIPRNIFNRLRWWFDNRLLCLPLPFNIVTGPWCSLCFVSFVFCFVFFTKIKLNMFKYLWVTSFSNGQNKTLDACFFPQNAEWYKLFTVQKKARVFHVSCLSQPGRRAAKQAVLQKALKSCLHCKVTAVLHQ